MKLYLAMAAAVAFVIPAAAAGAPADPLDFVKKKYTEIQDLVKRYPKKADLHQAIRDVMETFVDYRELSKRTLPGEWDKLKKKQQDEFIAEFKQMIQRTYVKRFNPEKEVRIDYKDSSVTDDGSAVVRSIVHSGKSEAAVDYRFHKQRGDWWAYDVVIDDVSMVQNYRKQFHDIVQKSGWDGLMAKIRKKNAKAQE
jgi:phospholipid transport system substrate-binding protein